MTRPNTEWWAGSPGIWARIIKVLMDNKFEVLVTRSASENIWTTHVPALNDLSTFGPTRDIALERTREAIVGYLEAAKLSGIEVEASLHAELVEVSV